MVSSKDVPQGLFMVSLQGFSLRTFHGFFQGYSSGTFHGFFQGFSSRTFHGFLARILLMHSQGTLFKD